MDIYLRAVYSGLTLYMMLLLLRWFAPWLSLELDSGRLKWVGRMCDPFVNWIRKILPPLGPVDLAPLAALLAVWFVRTLSLRIVVGMTL